MDVLYSAAGGDPIFGSWASQDPGPQLKVINMIMTHDLHNGRAGVPLPKGG